MSSTPTPSTEAVDAARVALALAQNARTADSLVLRAEHFADVHNSVRAVLQARNADPANTRIGALYRVAEYTAEYGVHGTHFTGGPYLDERGMVAMVVTLSSKFEIDALTQIPVIGEIDRQITQLEEETGAYVGLRVIIIEKVQG